jgi:hypothetical protein
MTTPLTPGLRHPARAGRGRKARVCNHERAPASNVARQAVKFDDIDADKQATATIDKAAESVGLKRAAFIVSSAAERVNGMEF